ncbi:WD40 repeat domain-containing protein, partial [Streptomyces yaizuensis]
IATLATTLRQSDPTTAMRLALAAHHTADLPETRAALTTAATQKEQDLFPWPVGTVHDLGADGRTLVSQTQQRVTFWDVTSHRRTASRPASKRFEAPGLVSPDTRWQIYQDDGHELLWDIRAARFRGGTLPWNTEFGPGGQLLLRSQAMSGREKLAFQVREPASRRLVGRARLPYPDTGAEVARLSADGRLLAVCIPGRQVEIWDVTRDRRVPMSRAPRVPATRHCREQESVFEFTPDGRRLVHSAGDGVRLWDIASGRELPRVHEGAFWDVEFSADGRYMAGVDNGGIGLWRIDTPPVLVLRHPLPLREAGRLRLDLGEGRLRFTTTEGVHSLSLEGVLTARWHSRPATVAAHSPDAAALAVARQDPDGRTRLRVSDSGGTGKVAVLPQSCPPPTRANSLCHITMAFRRDSRVLAYASSDFREADNVRSSTSVHFWDLPGRRTGSSLAIPGDEDGHPAWVTGLAFAPDGASLFLTGADSGRVQEWDLRRRAALRTLDAKGGGIDVRPDGKALATQYGAVAVLPSGRVTQSRNNHTAMLFSPDSRHLATADGIGQITLWGADSGRRLAVLAAGPSAATGDRPDAATVLAFSPDSGTLAAAGADGTIRLWDTTAHRLLGTLPTAGGGVLSLAFAPDGRTLRAASRHAPPQTYALDLQHMIKRVCARAGTGLSRDDWNTYTNDIPYRPTCPGPGRP